MTVVVTSYRYRPPPKRKPKLAVTVEVPVIVTAKKPREGRPPKKAPQVAVSISRKRAQLIAAARGAERSEVADDWATARAMASIARTLGMKPPKGA
jgi:hypothetical protein